MHSTFEGGRFWIIWKGRIFRAIEKLSSPWVLFGEKEEEDHELGGGHPIGTNSMQGAWRGSTTHHLSEEVGGRGSNFRSYHLKSILNRSREVIINRGISPSSASK